MELLQNAIEAMNSGLSIFQAVRDADGSIIDFDILYINEEACRITATTKELAAGNRMRELYKTRQVENFFKMFVKVVETGETVNKCLNFNFYERYGELKPYNIVCSKYGDGLVIVCQAISITENEISKRTEFFESKVDTSDKYVFLTDSDLKFVYFNNRWLKYRNAGLDSELSLSTKEFIHPDDVNGFYDKMSNIVFYNEPGFLEFRLMDGNGTYKWFSGVVCPEFTDTGNFVGCVGYCADYTEQKLYSESLQRFWSIISSIDVAIILKDKNGIITDWNKGAENILGYTAEETIGKTFEAYMPKEQLEELSKINKRLSDTLQAEHLWMRTINKSGRLVIAYVSYAPMFDINDEFSGYFIMFRDMTEEKLSEERTRNMAAIFNLADAGIILKNRKGIITDWNVGAENILGYSKDEMIGSTGEIYAGKESLGPLDDMNYMDTIERRIWGGEHISHLEVFRKHKDGRLIICSVSYTPIYDNESNVAGSIAIFHDITDKKIAEQKAKNLAAIFSGADAGIVLKDIDGVITDWNVGAQNILGYTADEIVGSLSTKYTPLEYIDISNQIEKRIDSGEHISHIELVRTHKDGRHINLSASFTPVRDKDSRITGSVAIFHDITEKKQIEKKHKELENTLTNLFDNMSGGFCLYERVCKENGDVDLKIVMANKAFAVLLNEPYESLNGRYFTEVCAGDVKYLPTYIRVTETCESLSFEKYSTFFKKHLNVVLYSPVRGQVAIIVSDRSHLVKAEEELKQAYKDTAAILSEIPAPICVVNKNDGIILDGNGAFAKTCLLDSKVNIAGTPISKYFHITEAGQNINILERLCAGVSFTCSMKKSDRSEIEVQVFSRPMIYDEQDAFVVYCIDLTQQRLQEQVLREAASAAEEASKMKSSFLANMSHEIRTPLNGVIGFSELALEEKNLGERIKDYLCKIRLSAYGLLDIINDVLDISKIEHGKVELEKVPFSLHEVFKHCETVSISKAMEKGITLYFYSEPYIGKKLIGDPTKLRQILLNLLSNAIKFTNVGIVKVMSLAEIINETQFKIYFEVKDSGIGMAEEELKRVFDPFTQADSSTTRKYGGTGLGLAITRSLVELMGGKIHADSLPSVGSKFSFTLIFDSVDVSADEPDSDVSGVTLISKPVFDGEALVCEDNEINQQVIKEHLLRIGLRPTLVSNGKAGVEAAKLRLMTGNPFDIVMMDIHMPIMDGLEATQKMIQMGCKAPIIAMTANVMSKEKEDYLAQGLSDYIGKPFVSHELWSCVLKYLKPVNLTTVVEEKRVPAESKLNGVIDKAVGINRSAEDVSLYEHLLERFVKSNKGTFHEFMQSLASGNKKHAHRIAHTIKGVSGTIGALKLQKASENLEAALAREDTLLPEKLVKEFERELNAVLNELSHYDIQKKDEKIKLAELDKEAVKEIIAKLEPLLVSGDSYSIDLIEHEKQKLMPVGKLYHELVAQIEDYDFDIAYETLTSIKRLLEG